MYGLSLLIKHTVLCALPLRARGLDVAVSLPQYFKENGYMTLGMLYIDTQLWVHCVEREVVKASFQKQIFNQRNGKGVSPWDAKHAKRRWLSKVLEWEGLELAINIQLFNSSTHNTQMFVRYFTQIPPMTPVTRGKPTLRRKWRKPLWGQHEVSKCSTMRSQLKENLWEHNRNPNRNMSKFLTGTLQTRTIRSRSWGSLLQLHWLERRTSSLLMVCTRWLEFEVH